MIQSPRFSPKFSARTRRNLTGVALGLVSASLVSLWGCSDSTDTGGTSTGGTSTGGTSTTGGTTSTGGTSTGGTSTGGTSTGGTSTGGTSTGGTSATGGTTSTGGTAPIPACVTTTLSTKCLSCHGKDTAPFFGGLDLSGDFLPRVLDKSATYMGVADMSKCMAGAKLIDSATPSNSVMLKKITKTQACGDSMPQAGTLTSDELTCLQNWIQTF